MASGGAELLEAAARLLERGEHDECKNKAKQAVEVLSKAGDVSGHADALRLVALCLCQAGRRKDAARLAEEELTKFREAGAKEAEAKMLLALSEANSIKRGPKKRVEALRTATDALRAFRELNDKKMQGTVLLVMVNVFLKGASSASRAKSLQDAVELAREALALFQMAGDERMQAEALHALAAARIQTGNFEAGLRHAKEALQKFQEVGMARSEVGENQCIAEWLLAADMPKQALPYAEDALSSARQLGCDSAWEASMASTVIHALIAQDDLDKAMKVASDMLLKYQESKDKRGEALVLDLTITIGLARDDPREALHAAEQALAVTKDGGGGKKHEAMLLCTIARLHLELEDTDRALEAAASAVALKLPGHADRLAAMDCLAGAQRARQDAAAALEAVADEREALRRNGDGRGEATAALLAAGLHAEVGESQRAAAVASEARNLFREVGDARGQAAALQLGAQVHTAAGRYDVVLRLANEAAPLMKEISDSSGQAAMLTLSAQATIMTLLQGEMEPNSFLFGDGVDKAAQSAKDAVIAARKGGDNAMVGTALCTQAQAQLLTSKVPEAVQAASSAVAIFRGSGDTHGEAYALILNASALLASGKTDKARDAAGKASAILVALEDVRGIAMAEHITSVIDNPPDLEQELEGYGGMAQVAIRSSSAAVVQSSLVASALKQSVRNTVNDIVGLDDIQDDTPLMNTGLTSQSAVLLRNALTKEFPGPSLPFTMMFDYPSIAHLTEFLLTRGGG